MKKKLVELSSVLLAAAMVAGVAQTDSPCVYTVVRGDEDVSAWPAADQDDPAGNLDEALIESIEHKFSSSFEATDSARLTELELDVYLNGGAKEIPDDKGDKEGPLGRDHEKAVKFDLPGFEENKDFSSKEVEELITYQPGEMKNDDLRVNTITFLKAAGVTFSGDKGKEKVSSAVGVDISYEGDRINEAWSFTLDTAQLKKIEFLVEAHTDNEDTFWGNDNFMFFDGTEACLYIIGERETETEVGIAADLKSTLEDGSYDTIRLTKDTKILVDENLVVTNPIMIDG